MNEDFSGIDQISIDPKGRFLVPKGQLEVLRFATRSSDGSFWLTRDVHEECLNIFLNDRWSEISKSLREQRNMTSEYKRLSRRIIGNAKRVSIDSAGRILVPKELREIGKLQTRALFVGNGDHFEIWDRVLFERAEANMSEDMQANSEKYDQILTKVS